MDRSGCEASEHETRPGGRARSVSPGIGRFDWGQSRVMSELRQQLAAAAPTSSGILLVGETGTGKGAVARAIHAYSRRPPAPWVHFDCAGQASGLIESALFGHERGSFTGAHARRLGAAEAAGAGTLFLDEVGELDRAAQPRLLRLLEDRVFERVGGGRAFGFEARVVAATNRDLAEDVRHGAFREDLFHRLSVVVLRVPPVRERPEDVPALLARSAERARRSTGAPRSRIAQAGLRVLIEYDWPGNVREIMNTLERASACWPGRIIDAELATRLVRVDAGIRPSADSPPTLPPTHCRPALPPTPTPASPPHQALQAILDGCDGNIARTARLLGLPRSTLRYRLRAAAACTSEESPPKQPCLPGLGDPEPPHPAPKRAIRHESMRVTRSLGVCACGFCRAHS